jgi:GMC oxidoreductase
MDAARWRLRDCTTLRPLDCAVQLSGIGPAMELRANGIEVVADIKGVGENFKVCPSTGRLQGGCCGGN